jgi:hypothetical protein
MNSGPEGAAPRIFEDVLANFAFLFGETRGADELPGLEGRACLACLPFRGPSAGCIAVGVPEGLALEIAANTLGVEPSDPGVPLHARDALKEVASVMGGHFASAMEASGTPVTLFPPQLFTLSAEDWDRLRTDPATHCFAVDRFPVLLCVGPKPGVLR